MSGRGKQKEMGIVRPPGNPEFWAGDRVNRYDHCQSLTSEQKEEMTRNIVRVVRYLCGIRSLSSPKVLDVGCGPGTPGTAAWQLLESIPSSQVFGVDSSTEMVDAANAALSAAYPGHFFGCVGDFNGNEFWAEGIDLTYDFIVSSVALHYLGDERRRPFFRELYEHLASGGALIASIAVSSAVAEVAEMADHFATEFLHQELERERGPQDFEEVRKRRAEQNAKAGVNRLSPGEYIESLHAAGFEKADWVWHLWTKSIFVALK